MKVATKISAYYFISGCLWIFVGSSLLNYFTIHELFPTGFENLFEVSKGLVFVFLTSLFLYLILSKVFKKQATSQIQYEKIFNESPIPMWICDAQTFRFLAVNQAAIASYEFSEKEFLKMGIEEIHLSEDWLTLQSFLRQENQNSYQGIWSHKKKSGDFFLVDIHCSSIEYFERPCYLVNAINIHEKILADQKNMELISTVAEYKALFEIQNRNLKEISWAHSHFIRAPLANILGLVQLLNQNNPSDPVNREVINKIEVCAKKLDTVIHEVIDKSRTE